MTTSAAGTVTDNAYPSRCLPVSRNAYQTLAGFALDFRDGWVHCSVCDGKSHWQHCLTCHQQPEYEVSRHNGKTYVKNADHGSCFGCGACLPARVRHGRIYCSTTCRVRAHNFYHGTATGRAKLAEYERNRDAFAEAAINTFGRVSEERIRQRKAKHYGKTCGKCGDDLADGEPVWRQRRSGVPTCRACCPDPDVREVWGTARWLGPLPCDGCSRPVYFRGNDTQRYRREAGRFVRWVVCSTRCYQDVKHREQKAKRAADREPIDCGVCGERIDARRRDTSFCSSACRQKAYRTRAAACPDKLSRTTPDMSTRPTGRTHPPSIEGVRPVVRSERPISEETLR
jgi:hypothetical protein